MTLTIPCGRAICAGTGRDCREGALCPHCNAIVILKAACLGVADRLEGFGWYPKGDIYEFVQEQIGRLRADVARVGGD